MVCQTLLLSTTMFGGLLGIYGAMESHWPASYVNVTTPSGQLGRFSFWWYLFFRSAPTFLVTLVTAVSAERLGLSPSCTVAVGLTAFALFAIYHSIRGPQGMASRDKVILVGFVGMVLSLISGALALALRSHLEFIIPPPSALLEAIWTALFVAVAYFAFKRLLDDRPVHTSLPERAKRDIRRVWKFSQSEADRHGLPVAAVRAVLLAEAIQRPRWFRALERALQCVLRVFRKESTTGIAQMKSLKPLSDWESVTLLCGDMNKWVSEHSELNDEKSISEYARHHNDDDVFVDSVVEQYKSLDRLLRFRI